MRLGASLPRIAQSGFNSRTPGGVRLSGCNKLEEVSMFQFTHPGRGATPINSSHSRGGGVSIHAPREGCDYTELLRELREIAFQFTHPGGVRLRPGNLARSASSFNSRTREGCDGSWAHSINTTICFNSRTREGCDSMVQSCVLWGG